MTDYTTLDLPLGIVAQACFLGQTLGPDKIWFAGEDEGSAEGRIRLFSAGAKLGGRYGVAFNIDSMTEMRWRDAFAYACWLGNHARLFFSLNHMRNSFTVGEVMTFAGMTRLRREGPGDVPGYVPSLGYCEEVYALRPVSVAPLRREAFHVFLHGKHQVRTNFRWRDEAQ